MIERQLLEKEKTEKIKELMLSSLDDSGKEHEEYESKKSCLEDISSYIDGEFTLFERGEILSPFTENISPDERPEDRSFLDEVARHLLDEGIVASDEVIEKGIEEYNMKIPGSRIYRCPHNPNLRNTGVHCPQTAYKARR